MELWEFYACTKGFAQRQELRGTESLVASWRTGNFVGAAFGGKLKSLKYYLRSMRDTKEQARAPKISIEDFEAGLARVQGRQKWGDIGGA